MRMITQTYHSIIAVCTLMISGAAMAQTANPDSQMVQWCDKLKRNSGDMNALDGLTISPKIFGQKSLEVQIVDQYSQIVDSYGLVRSCDSIKVAEYGANLVTHYIVVSHKEMASFWELSFFNTVSGWQLVSFNFNSDFAPFADKLNGVPDLKLTDSP